MEGSLDCWANHWYNPPYSPITVFIQSEQNGWQNHSRPLTSSTLPLWTVTIWSTLQSSEYQNNQTQEQFLPSSNPSHEHLTIIMVHTLFIHLYTYLSNTHTQSTLQLHIIYMYIQNCPLLYTYTYNWQFVYCYSLFTCWQAHKLTRAVMHSCQHCLAKHDTGFLESVIRETRAHRFILAHSHTHVHTHTHTHTHAVAFPSSAKFSGHSTSETNTQRGCCWMEYHDITGREGLRGGASWLNNRHVITLLAFQMTSAAALQSQLWSQSLFWL